jgi:5,10-methylenetetrahydromethanopterin reductase
MMLLSDNRFALGVGRGFNALADSMGIPHLRFALFEDYFDILRRLWRGETVDYKGPLGALNGAKLGLELDVIPPLMMAAMGPKTLFWSGQHADGVLLSSLWSAAGTAASVEIVRRGAEAAGRDPDSVKVWAIVVTASDVSEEKELEYIVRRMGTYAVFPAFLEAICEANQWSLAEVLPVRQAILADMSAGNAGNMGDEGVSRELDQLRRMRNMWPEKWLYEGNAIGTAQHCAGRLQEYFDAGVDGIVLHGSRPQDLATLLEIWPQYRQAEKFDNRPITPGL